MPKINELDGFEKPRERCLRSGPEALSLRECLAILLGSGPKGEGCLGLAGRLVSIGVENPVNGAPAKEEDFFRRIEDGNEISLQGIRGLGPAGQAKLLAVMEVARRYFRFRDSQRVPVVDCDELPSFVQARVPSDFRSSIVEKVGLVPCFSSGAIGEFQLLQSGSESAVHLSRRQLLRVLVSMKAEGFWLFHNHPGHDLVVSQPDREATREIRSLTRLLGIHLFGHWIVTEQNFVQI